MFSMNATVTQERAVAGLVGLAVLGAVIYLFARLLMADATDPPEGMIAAPRMADVEQPAMVSLDPLGAQEIGIRGQEARTNMRRPYGDKTQFYPDVDLNPPPVNIAAAKSVLDKPMDRGNIMRNVVDITNNQGVVQDVTIAGEQMARENVQYGIFSNHQFYPRTDQFPQHPQGHLFDPSEKPPRSHFGPMTYPLVGPIGALGMDYFRPGNNDTRVNIASTGGRH